MPFRVLYGLDQLHVGSDRPLRRPIKVSTGHVGELAPNPARTNIAQAYRPLAHARRDQVPTAGGDRILTRQGSYPSPGNQSKGRLAIPIDQRLNYPWSDAAGSGVGLTTRKTGSLRKLSPGLEPAQCSVLPPLVVRYQPLTSALPRGRPASSSPRSRTHPSPRFRP